MGKRNKNNNNNNNNQQAEQMNRKLNKVNMEAAGEFDLQDAKKKQGKGNAKNQKR